MKTAELASIRRVYAYLGMRTEINPDDVIDSYGITELRVEDLRAVLAALRGAPDSDAAAEPFTADEVRAEEALDAYMAGDPNA
jgi:hypothetical protein